MTNPASSDNTPAASDAPKVEQTPPLSEEPPLVDSKAFANTKEHVAGWQQDEDGTERFTNTKLNIALINDPKNGPRFTMTKREAGVAEGPRGEESLPRSQLPDPGSNTDGSSSKPSISPPAEQAAPSSASVISQSTGSGHDGTETSAGEGRMASRPHRSGARPLGVPPPMEPPSKLPIDSSKTFVGVNGTFYDESWRWMDWRGTRRSWNWPAALSFGHWFAYRRLYRYASLHLLWLASLAAAAVNNVPIMALIAAVPLIACLTGVYGNRLYFHAYRRAVSRVTKTGKGSYQDLQRQLAAAGGTSSFALGVMSTLSLAGIIGALGATLYLRGTLLFNLWPFF